MQARPTGRDLDASRQASCRRRTLQPRDAVAFGKANRLTDGPTRRVEPNQHREVTTGPAVAVPREQRETPSLERAEAIEPKAHAFLFARLVDSHRVGVRYARRREADQRSTRHHARRLRGW